MSFDPQPPTDSRDIDALHRALALAESAIGLSDPNPRVGCVIHAADGGFAGAGSTQRAGEAHAEVMALRAAQAAGANVRGGTAWVTLEPCAHHGRTPPCCDALIAAGLARVVVACTDPNPLVAGQGIARMRAAGIQVDVAGGDVARAARELNIGFFSRMLRQRPWVRMKVAASLDGRTALNNGASQWITGDAARRDGHAWRRRAGAVLTGSGTVLADNPRLDVRLVPSTLQPLRVVVDSRLRTPATARLLAEPGRALVYTLDAAHPAADALRTHGATVVAAAARAGQVDLAAVLADLHQRHVNELHLEAGATLNGAWLRAGLVDELLLYVAPMLLGSGRGMADLGELQALADAPRLALHEVTRVGDDLRVLARVPGHDAFLYD